MKTNTPETPEALIASLPEERRATMTALHKAIRKTAPKLAPLVRPGMGGTTIVSYGTFHFKTKSGREGDWFLIGLAAGKKDYALHICAGDKQGYLVDRHAGKLGKVKTGKTCINFTKLEDLDLAAAMALVKQAEKLGGFGSMM